MKILVSGCSGYIGSHFTKFFSQHGHQVYGIDKVSLPTALGKYTKGFLHSDIREKERVADFCMAHQIEAVVHCAALCLVGESVNEPEKYFDGNVVATKAFLQGIGDANIKHFLFSSTAAVYGEPQTVPITEDHPKKPINPYGETKYNIEQYLAKLKEEQKLCVGVFRYFNAAGADPDAEIGEVHEPETHLIPNAILAALQKRPAFELFGTNYDTRDQTCERDFIHVWDLAQAHLILIERMKQSGEGGTYNLATGRGFTVLEVIHEIEKQLGQEVPLEKHPRREGDPSVLVANAGKAMKELGWKPTYSSISQIVSTALAWHQKRST